MATTVFNLRGQALRADFPSKPLVAGEVRLTRSSRSAAFAHPSKLSDGELIVITRKDAFHYESWAAWLGELVGFRYRYHRSSADVWIGTIERDDQHRGDVVCNRQYTPVECTVTLSAVAPGWPKPLVQFVGSGTPFNVQAVCSPIYLLPPMASTARTVPQPRDVFLTLDDGTRIDFPDSDRCRKDNGELLERILASERLRLSALMPGEVTPVIVSDETRAAEPALRLAAYLSSLNEDNVAALRKAASAAEAQIAPFSLKDALSQTREWRGAFRCFVEAKRTSPMVPSSGEGVCAHWIKSLRARANAL